MVRLKSRKSPPSACGDNFEMLCMVADRKGFKFKCGVNKEGEIYRCGNAEFDIRKGVIKFYG